MGLFSICKPNSRIRRFFSSESEAERMLARIVCFAKGITAPREVDLRRVTIWEMRRVRIGKTREERNQLRKAA